MLKLALFLLPIVYYLYRSLSRWRANYLEAKASGIPYIVSPIFPFSTWWLLGSPILVPVVRALPAFLGEPWRHLVYPEFSWSLKYSVFEKMGSDTILIVTPNQTMCLVADADVVIQVSTRRNDFPKPLGAYKILDIYGKNVVTMEGKEWRRHRKITAPQFGEHNNRMVFSESVFQAGQMVKTWMLLGQKVDTHTQSANGQANGHSEKQDRKSTATLCSGVAQDAMKLSLHVISRAGFDVRCLWPGLPTAGIDTEGAMSADVVPEGHTMSYVHSLETLLHRILPILIMPRWLLNTLPIKFVQTSREAFQEWGKYMQELYDQKVHLISHQMQERSDVEGLDLMGAMIRGSGQIEGTANHGKSDAGLSPTEVIGNAFILFLAGHETAANVIHFCIVYMATRPGFQRQLQAELDSIFGDRDPEQWSYDKDLPKLFEGLTGAIMNEVLRLIPPVIGIPKSTEGPERLRINGTECTMPSKSFIILNAAAIHRNPKYWPHGKARSPELGGPMEPLTNSSNDLDEFKPERWLKASEMTKSFMATHNQAPIASKEDKPSDDLAVNTAPDTAATMFNCPKGAYIPFSAGFRACSGRRFAQVEILAALAVIFRRNSVELDVGPYVLSEDSLQSMSKSERRSVWMQARTEVERKLKEEMATTITIQLRKGPVKLRICERGREVFDFDD